MEPCVDCTYIMQHKELMDRMDALQGKLTCLAFYPNPIPEDIADGTEGHDIPHPGQANKLVFRQQSPV
ncbi:hypothetical protein LCGC14_1291680 [marine sediment metagenome]|uniref:Uncharacterized protein n=1 Tax=marine sediment metagenome TaxID=412755 RepID=A0A0F9LD11_9ZZZZ